MLRFLMLHIASGLVSLIPFAGVCAQDSSKFRAKSPNLQVSQCDGGACLNARVVGVTDGDTVTLLLPGAGGIEQVKARLTEIDAPERAQPWGARARQALANKVFGRQVQVPQAKQDRYGRLLARLYLDGRDINREMVREGHAWVYRSYATENWLPDEAQARSAGLGLWSLGAEQAVAPWQWRRGERARKLVARNDPQPPTDTQQGFSCGAKRYCKQMTSCEEALFHLASCGLSSLDGDKDGLPCESLCRGNAAGPFSATALLGD